MASVLNRHFEVRKRNTVDACLVSIEGMEKMINLLEKKELK